MGLKLLTTNESLSSMKESKPRITWDKVHHTIKKNGYLIVQAVLNKFTAEIQNANSINKKVVDFNSVFGVELQVKSGFKSFLKQIFQICKSFK